jgi:hypothetical protein
VFDFFDTFKDDKVKGKGGEQQLSKEAETAFIVNAYTNTEPKVFKGMMRNQG